VAPTDPAEPEEADVADPGKVDEIKAEQKEAKSGKYGAVSMKPFKASEADKAADKKEKTAWIEVELVDEDGEPVPGEGYRITLPDDSVAEGSLDDKGKARVEGFKPGNCKVTFPDLDEDAWKPA